MNVDTACNSSVERQVNDETRAEERRCSGPDNRDKKNQARLVERLVKRGKERFTGFAATATAAVVAGRRAKEVTLTWILPHLA